MGGRTDTAKLTVAFPLFYEKRLKVCENSIHNTELDVANFSILFSPKVLVIPRMSPSTNRAQVFETACTFHPGFARESVTVSHFTSLQAT